jgi:hypothetical protein
MAPTGTRAARELHPQSTAHRNPTTVKQGDPLERVAVVLGAAGRVRVDYATQYLQ